MRLAQRLLAGSFAIVSLLIVAVVAVVDDSLRDEMTAQSIRQLEREARLVGAQWTAAADADALADDAGRALTHRVTLIDEAGRVVGDSEFDAPALAALENHARRPEVLAARDAGLGSARRRSPSAGDDELYVAVRATRGIARVSLATRDLAAIFDRARRNIYGAGLLALLAALLATWFFARTVSRPIVELRDVARALADGDRSRRPALSAPGEVGDLSRTVHRLAEQLDTRLGALEAEQSLLSQLFDSLNEGAVAIDARRQVVRINEAGRRLLDVATPTPFPFDMLPRDRALRDALADALAGEATEELETVLLARNVTLTARPLASGGAVLALLDLTPVRRLEIVRRDFVANVSHELRTPLTIIGGFAETLLDDDLSVAQRQHFAETIVANAGRMQRIVDDLLDLSRIESGGWRPAPRDVDLRAVTGEVLDAVRGAADAKGLELVAAIPPEAASVWADPTAVRQVIANLAENAVRHTPSGHVAVAAARSPDGGVEITVRDTGVGIRVEHLDRIFERFYRVDAARSREGGGTGLGLAIVKHLVDAHGGRVRAESTPGRGTTIHVSFPPRGTASPQ